jgi:hypothetical protein
MPVPVSPVLWAGPLIWLTALAVVSFLVTWVAADKLRMRRTSLMKLMGPSGREPCRPERPSGGSV